MNAMRGVGSFHNGVGTFITVFITVFLKAIELTEPDSLWLLDKRGFASAVGTRNACEQGEKRFTFN